MPLKQVSKSTHADVHMNIDDTKLLPNETYLRSSDGGSSDKIAPINKEQNSDMQSAHEDGQQQGKDDVHLPVEKTAIHHANPTLTLLHHAVVELDYSLVSLKFNSAHFNLCQLSNRNNLPHCLPISIFYITGFKFGISDTAYNITKSTFQAT